MLADRRGDQPAACEIVNVPRQQGELVDKVALLAGIEHTEHFGDRSAVIGWREGRVGPDTAVGHCGDFRMRGRRSHAWRRGPGETGLVGWFSWRGARINSCSNTFVRNARGIGGGGSGWSSVSPLI